MWRVMWSSVERASDCSTGQRLHRTPTWWLGPFCVTPAFTPPPPGAWPLKGFMPGPGLSFRTPFFLSRTALKDSP